MTPAERTYFSMLAAQNRQKLSDALNSIIDGQRHLVVGISYDEDSDQGPRGVGVAMVIVLDRLVRVRYLIKEGQSDRGGDYCLSLDAATEIIQSYVGTREAMNFRRLGCD